MPDVRVAVSDDFLDAFADIPKSQQSKVRRFLTKFRRDPTASGINYEKIQGARDDKLRSVRIDQAYRGIVMKPEAGNVYMLMWVDHHDDAYDWARNKLVQVHPETGSLQVIPLEEGQPVGAASDDEPEDEEEPTGLYAEHRDRELRRLGVPDALLPLVRSIETEDQLDDVQQYLPQEAYEALFLLAAGYSQREVDQELARLRSEREVDTEDYAAALENPDSQRRFQVVEEEDELRRMLDAPLDKWRVFLHPSQQRLVMMQANGPVRVLGGAGTGKTVVAMHRAVWLAEHVFTDPGDRLLFTTFTRNLASDIASNLRSICSEETLRRIEIANLDAWATRFLNEQGYDYRIDYGQRTEELWQQALSLAPEDLSYSETFLRGEWEQVIQSGEITERDGYMRVRRVGRGTPLKRPDRAALWPVFDEYRALLDEHKLRERAGALRDARQILERQQDERSGPVLPYRSIIVDEAQDMGKQAFKLIRQMIPGGDQPNDLFLVGDAHQRIYDRQVVMSHCGINIVGRGRKLRINYRTTEENRRWAVRLLQGVDYDDLDGGVDDQAVYKSLMHGQEPTVRRFDTFQEETDAISDFLLSRREEGEALQNTCLIARTKRLLGNYEGALQSAGLKTYVLQRSEADDRSRPGVRLATMHRAKGLEFDRVVVAGVKDGTVPLNVALRDAADDVDARQALKRERSLLYVSSTRAKHEVIVTCHGTPSPWLPEETEDA